MLTNGKLTYDLYWMLYVQIWTNSGIIGNVKESIS